MMRPRAVIAPLKGEELMDRCDGGAVRRRQSDCPSPRQAFHHIPDLGTPGRHDGGTRHLPCVHEAGHGEIPGGERRRDAGQVLQDPAPADAVGGVALELDASPVRQRLEEMGRSLLIDPHRGMPAGLHLGEGAVGGRGRVAGAGAGGRV
jgi:hypothetical protein